ncbi:MAG TPA: hypothetical protein VGG16_24360 [Streptosporangiaceae bacterium]
MQRRYKTGRGSNLKILAGVLVLGVSAAAIGIGVTSHGATPAAQSASYDSGYHATGMGEWTMLDSAVAGWGSSMGSSLSQLASVKQLTYGQSTEHGKTLDVQRGIVVFASQRFLILQSKNGALHLWVLSGRTGFENVADSRSGTTALTTSPSASMQAVNDGQMIPAVDMLAGDATTAAGLLTPSSKPQTVMVQVAGTDLTVTVTITRNTAAMSQTATMPASGSPVSDPASMTASAWSTAGMTSSLARGDLAMVVGSRSHGLLHAQIVLYTPLSVGDVGGYLGGANQPGGAPAPTAESTHY